MTSQDDKREPRVYFADFNRHPDSEDDFFDFLAGDLLHKHPGQGPLVWQSSLVPMIEKKHYDALLAENQKLKSENAVLREAVEFYADPSSYYINGSPYSKNHVDDSDLEEADEPQPNSSQKGTFCGGKRAREALKKVGK